MTELKLKTKKNHHQLATNDLTTQIHSGGRLQSGLQTRMQNSESGVQGLRSPESPATLSGLISLYHFLESRTAELLQNNNSSSELGNCFLLDGYELGSSRPLGVLYVVIVCFECPFDDLNETSNIQIITKISFNFCSRLELIDEAQSLVNTPPHK